MTQYCLLFWDISAILFGGSDRDLSLHLKALIIVDEAWGKHMGIEYDLQLNTLILLSSSTANLGMHCRFQVQ